MAFYHPSFCSCYRLCIRFRQTNDKSNMFCKVHGKWNPNVSCFFLFKIFWGPRYLISKVYVEKLFHMKYVMTFIYSNWSFSQRIHFFRLAMVYFCLRGHFYIWDAVILFYRRHITLRRHSCAYIIIKTLSLWVYWVYICSKGSR